MTSKAFVRTTRPNFHALSAKKQCTREISSMTGNSSHEELNRPGTLWHNHTVSKYNCNPYRGMTPLSTAAVSSIATADTHGGTSPAPDMHSHEAWSTDVATCRYDRTSSLSADCASPTIGSTRSTPRAAATAYSSARIDALVVRCRFVFPEST